MGYSNIQSCGTGTPKSSWDNELLNSASKLLCNAQEVRCMTQDVVQRILGCECKTEQERMPCAPIQEPDNFNWKMQELLREIAQVGREIRHQIERL